MEQCAGIHVTRCAWSSRAAAREAGSIDKDFSSDVAAIRPDHPLHVALIVLRILSDPGAWVPSNGTSVESKLRRVQRATVVEHGADLTEQPVRGVLPPKPFSNRASVQPVDLVTSEPRVRIVVTETIANAESAVLGSDTASLVESVLTPLAVGEGRPESTLLLGIPLGSGPGAQELEDGLDERSMPTLPLEQVWHPMLQSPRSPPANRFMHKSHHVGKGVGGVNDTLTPVSVTSAKASSTTQRSLLAEATNAAAGPRTLPHDKLA